MMRVLQVCNVGKIVGGTAACAWSITQALPDCEHQVIFLSKIHDDTRQAFSTAELKSSKQLDTTMINAAHCDVVILHNTSKRKIVDPVSFRKLSIPVLQYAHSAIDHYHGDINVICSNWLQKKLTHSGHEFKVLYQPVPLASLKLLDGMTLPHKIETEIIIGRISTPQTKKWSPSCFKYYHQWSKRFPTVIWEFVGCPREIQHALFNSCNGKARFFPASFQARGHLCRWDAVLYHQPSCVESFGRVVAEALRVGCIPIVDNLGGFCEQIKPDSGFLCDEEIDFELALDQIHDNERKHELAEHAKLAGEQFSYESFRRQFFNLFA